MEKKPISKEKPNETGAGLSLSIIGLYVLLQVGGLMSGVTTGPLKSGLGTVLIGLSLIVFGSAFLASYFFSHKAFLFRGLIWLCENLSHPKGRGMAFFYFLLAGGLGIMAVLTGLGVI